MRWHEAHKLLVYPKLLFGCVYPLIHFLLDKHAPGTKVLEKTFFIFEVDGGIKHNTEQIRIIKVSHGPVNDSPGSRSPLKRADNGRERPTAHAVSVAWQINNLNI